MRVLPGQPTDGGGVVCIHLFVRDESGPITERAASASSLARLNNTLATSQVRGRLACDPKRTVAPVTRNGVTTVTPRTDDPRAVTCLKCLASPLYKKALALTEPPAEPVPVPRQETPATEVVPE